MLCVNNYPQEYLNECRATIQTQVDAYQNLVASSTDPAAVEAFEPLYFNNLVLQLDFLFVHRSRTLEGKDGNPVNEVRILCNSLTNNGSKMLADKGIKLNPSTSVLKYQTGDTIRLNQADFLRLADAYFAQIATTYPDLQPA